MVSMTCGTSLASPGQIEVFSFARIRTRDIKHLENFARCFQRIYLQDETFLGGTVSMARIETRHPATCGLINRFLGSCSLERSDSRGRPRPI